GRRGLVDDERGEQLRREDVEVEGAIAVRRSAVSRGRDRFHAVQADAGELRAETAHRDRAALAGVALDRDAGNALQRFGEILVGEFGDVLGDDHVHRAGRVALLVERLVERGAQAGDDDLVAARGRVARLLRLDRRNRQRRERRAARQPGPAAYAPYIPHSQHRPPFSQRIPVFGKE